MRGYLLLPLLNLILFTFLGYLIKYRKILEMLAGYDPKKVEDKEGLANWVGTNFIILGTISLLLLLVGIYASNLNGKIYIWINVALMFALIVVTAIGARRY